MTRQTLYRRNFLPHLQERQEFHGQVLLKEPALNQLTVAQIAQLHNEYVISQQLGHLPGVRPVYAIEGSESHPVLILEYVEGNSLAQLIEGQSLDLSQKLQVGVQIATIVGRLHEEGVMHRDISSSNVLVAREGTSGKTAKVTLIDFGLATPNHPLVVFLDDLQWIDSASLNLIEALMAAQSRSSFLLIGAYRDNEVGADHPLVASQDRIGDATGQLSVITVGDLTADDVSHLLADTLQLNVAECRYLSQVLVDKTAGNPFYFRRLLYAMESKEELRFDRQRQRWVWANTLQQSLRARGSVVDLMLRNLEGLPADTQRTLSTAACLGSRFELYLDYINLFLLMLRASSR